MRGATSKSLLLAGRGKVFQGLAPAFRQSALLGSKFLFGFGTSSQSKVASAASFVVMAWIPLACLRMLVAHWIMVCPQSLQVKSLKVVGCKAR